MRHPDNNWCASNFADSLQLAIYDFYNWSLSEDEGGVAIILSLNDMSLQLGGRYDIDALWDRSIDPKKPQQRHYYHRTGTSVDINPPLSADQLENLETYMNNHQLVRNEERPQIHFGFNEGN